MNGLPEGKARSTEEGNDLVGGGLLINSRNGLADRCG